MLFFPQPETHRNMTLVIPENAMKYKQHKIQQQNKGFTLIEVLVGILMATIFVLITSQAIALSALFRVRAQRESEAVLWIQEDFEDIKFKSIQALPSGDCSASRPIDGYAAAVIGVVDGTINSFSQTTTQETFLNKSYTATRTLSYYDDSPFHIMTVSYSITDETNEIANFYTEVLPDAALRCN